jgi:hypothetical protein
MSSGSRGHEPRPRPPSGYGRARPGACPVGAGAAGALGPGPGPARSRCRARPRQAGSSAFTACGAGPGAAGPSRGESAADAGLRVRSALDAAGLRPRARRRDPPAGPPGARRRHRAASGRWNPSVLLRHVVFSSHDGSGRGLNGDSTIAGPAQAHRPFLSACVGHGCRPRRRPAMESRTEIRSWLAAAPRRPPSHPTTSSPIPLEARVRGLHGGLDSLASPPQVRADDVARPGVTVLPDAGLELVRVGHDAAAVEQHAAVGDASSQRARSTRKGLAAPVRFLSVCAL